LLAPTELPVAETAEVTEAAEPANDPALPVENQSTEEPATVEKPV
jgi:hypothetical protein